MIFVCFDLILIDFSLNLTKPTIKKTDYNFFEKAKHTNVIVRVTRKWQNFAHIFLSEKKEIPPRNDITNRLREENDIFL